MERRARLRRGMRFPSGPRSRHDAWRSAIAVLAAGTGEGIDVAFELFSVFVFHFQEFDADARPESYAGDFSEGPDFLLSDPERQSEFCAFLEGARHFDEAAAQTYVGDTAPYTAFLGGRVKFDR